MTDEIGPKDYVIVERLIRRELKASGPESPSGIVDLVVHKRPEVRPDAVRSAMWSMLAMGDLLLNEEGKVSAS